MFHLIFVVKLLSLLRYCI